MTTYRSKREFFKQGPALEGRFCVQDDKLVEIFLTESEKGFSWYIEADRPSPAAEKSIATWLGQYVKGQQPKVSLPLALDWFPPFTFRVLEQLQQIPFGALVSYRELAEALKKPLAARAVGNACGRNPLPLVIPCHRVIASDRSIGGFSMGLPIKKALLTFEGTLP